MTATPPDTPAVGEDRLVRVVVNLPRSLVHALDERTGPGRSRGAVCRDLLTEAIELKVAS